MNRDQHSQINATLESANYQETDKLIVLTYPNGGGGKFVSNCLALSSHVFAMIPKKNRRDVYLQKILNRVSAEIQPHQGIDDLVRLLGKLKVDVEIEKSGQLILRYDNWRHLVLRFFRRYSDVDIRMDWIRGTLPDSEIGIDDWGKLEFSAIETFGIYRGGVEFSNPSFFRTEYIEELHDSSLFHFTVAHLDSKFTIIRNQIPNCRQIRFSKTRKWIDHCVSMGKQFHDIPENEECDLSTRGVDFNVESFFSETGFLGEVDKLYQYFSLPDYNCGAISAFHRDYMSVHGISM